MPIKLRLYSLRSSAWRRAHNCVASAGPELLAGRDAASDQFQSPVFARFAGVHRDADRQKLQKAHPRRKPSTAFFSAALAMGFASLPFPCIAAQGAVEVTQAWVPATQEVGSDIPLLMMIRNELTISDALLRARCPIANFSERHTVDRGEGAPAMRAVSSIPIAAQSTLVLRADAFHVMLLQTTQSLQAGDRFKCSLVFQQSGTMETEVEVRRAQ